MKGYVLAVALGAICWEIPELHCCQSLRNRFSLWRRSLKAQHVVMQNEGNHPLFCDSHPTPLPANQPRPGTKTIGQLSAQVSLEWNPPAPVHPGPSSGPFEAKPGECLRPSRQQPHAQIAGTPGASTAVLGPGFPLSSRPRPASEALGGWAEWEETVPTGSPLSTISAGPQVWRHPLPFSVISLVSPFLLCH